MDSRPTLPVLEHRYSTVDKSVYCNYSGHTCTDVRILMTFQTVGIPADSCTSSPHFERQVSLM